MIRKLREYLTCESGQTSTEYILLVAVVAMIVFKFKNLASEKLTEITDKTFSGMEGILDEIN